MTKEFVAAQIRESVILAIPDAEDISIERHMQDYDIDTDADKVRIEITFTIPRVAKAK